MYIFFFLSIRVKFICHTSRVKSCKNTRTKKDASNKPLQARWNNNNKVITNLPTAITSIRDELRGLNRLIVTIYLSIRAHLCHLVMLYNNNIYLSIFYVIIRFIRILCSFIYLNFQLLFTFTRRYYLFYNFTLLFRSLFEIQIIILERLIQVKKKKTLF